MLDQTLLNNLRQNGYKFTGPRLKLLHAMVDSEHQFTAEEIHSRVNSVGRATVYRTIKLLLALDILCKVTLDDGTPLYSLGRKTHHHHLICTKCDTVADFQRCTVDDIISRLQEATQYNIEWHRIEIYGTCIECQTKTN